MLSLLTLDGAPVTVPDERSRPTLLLATKDARASGMAGVNRFSGTYTQEGSALKFSPLMATKMAGAPELNELETRYLRMLGQVTGWRVRNETLELLAGEQVLAGFVRKP